MSDFTAPTISYTTAIPDSAKAGGRTAGTNPYQQFMMDMPAPAVGKKGAATQYAWFFVAADVADTITDPAERARAQKSNTQKLVNKFTSLSRRIRKANSATHDFTFRKMRDPDQPEDGAWGIVVYRIEPGSQKGGPGSAQKAAA